MDKKGVIRQRRGMWIKPPSKKIPKKVGKIFDFTPHPLQPPGGAGGVPPDLPRAGGQRGLPGAGGGGAGAL